MSSYKPVKGHEEMVARWMNNPEFSAAYDSLGDEYQVTDALLEARQNAGLCQEEVANRMGISRLAVSRIESPGGKYSPSIKTLKRYAEALGFKLQIRFVSTKAA